MGFSERIEHLKQKWEVRSNLDFFLIMAVFSLAGMNVTLMRKPIFHLLGLTAHTALWIKTVAYILFIFPTYQVSLLLYGLLLGQFNFFWEKEKKLFKFLSQKILKIYTASSK
ncbi:MAG: hypothetical protein A2787_04160 [Omnitrophica WOR_2 bacterium RIFCSPHIGHO2_01_FULL_48_9]|nr:MAG: hypothetical protein A3D10_07440 [Omnitrophica WOR_2 bacterium RIFCSPHIGHO2_02_FULL_48_11]OGX34178.1 MAG: hypothetical protein A2787_04160 [Omnitrophica WOR_2 bacterium RIFCSPHIGHO2_01_FULL_48_9]